MPKVGMINVVIIIVICMGVLALLSKKPKSPTANNIDNLSALVTPTSAPVPTVSQLDSLHLQISSTPKQNMTKLIIEDLKVGTGPEVKSGDTVSMNYLGTLADGTKFDSSYDRGQPFETQIGVGRVIQGWDQGVPGMKVGGKRRLSIPSELAYGAQGAGGVIPPNADLIFEVELVGIK